MTVLELFLVINLLKFKYIYLRFNQRFASRIQDFSKVFLVRIRSKVYYKATFIYFERYKF